MSLRSVNINGYLILIPNVLETTNGSDRSWADNLQQKHLRPVGEKPSVILRKVSSEGVASASCGPSKMTTRGPLPQISSLRYR